MLKEKSEYKQYNLSLLKSEMEIFQDYAATKDLTFKQFIRDALKAYIRMNREPLL